MLRLEELARDAVLHRTGAALALCLDRLAKHLHDIDAARQQYAGHITTARTDLSTNELEIDDQPIVSASPGSSGAFVSAWVWIEQP